MNISKQARSTLRAIAYWQRQHNGKSPTYAELAKVCSVSAATIFKRVRALRKEGALKPTEHTWRALEIVDPEFSLQSWDQLKQEIVRLQGERDELAGRLAEALKKLGAKK